MHLEQLILNRLKQLPGELEQKQEELEREEKCRAEGFKNDCKLLADIAIAAGVSPETISPQTPTFGAWGEPAISFALLGVHCRVTNHGNEVWADVEESRDSTRRFYLTRPTTEAVLKLQLLTPESMQFFLVEQIAQFFFKEFS